MNLSGIPQYWLEYGESELTLRVAENVSDEVRTLLFEALKQFMDVPETVTFSFLERVDARLYDFLQAKVARGEIVESFLSPPPGYKTRWVLRSFLADA